LRNEKRVEEKASYPLFKKKPKELAAFSDHGAEPWKRRTLRLQGISTGKQEESKPSEETSVVVKEKTVHAR